MKKIAFLLLAVMAASVPAFASHNPRDFVKTGEVLVGDLFPAVTFVTPCDETSGTNGVDGRMVQLPAGSATHDITLTGADVTGLADVDVQFLDSECHYIDGTALQNEGDEAGKVPAGAAWAEVDLFTGVNATFTLTVVGVLPA